MIVPVFIPHLGCPYRCVFCNQTDITGNQGRADEKKLDATLTTYLGETPPDQLPPNREVAFYGGSFTGLPAKRQENLLKQVQPWVQKGLVSAIRLSTHPLYIDEGRLVLLKQYGVRTIELGIQSTDPEVLELSGRPCPWETVKSAVKLIRKNGFRLGLQLMSGLPGDTEETFLESVDDVISLKPDFARLYPTLVIRHTELFQLYQEGEFTPWSLDFTVDVLSDAIQKFSAEQIPVIRLGLHPDPSMLENLVAGPYHPSLRYLVDCRIGLNEMVDRIRQIKKVNGTVKFKVPSKRISVYIGHKRKNIETLKKMFRLENVILQPERNCDRLRLIA